MKPYGTKASPLSYLRGTITQGSADAFVQSSVTTGLDGETTLCYRVRHLVFEFSLGMAEVDASYEFGFSRKSLAAVGAWSDKHVIYRYVRQLTLTTSGLISHENVIERRFDGDEFLIVEDPLYAFLDSTGTSGANVVRYSLGYEEVRIDASERLDLLVTALQG
jgi:hypothetical protein